MINLFLVYVHAGSQFWTDSFKHKDKHHRIFQTNIICQLDWRLQKRCDQ